MREAIITFFIEIMSTYEYSATGTQDNFSAYSNKFDFNTVIMLLHVTFLSQEGKNSAQLLHSDWLNTKILTRIRC